MSIEGPKGMVNLEKHIDKDGQIVCSYVAVSSGEYHINILKKGEHIHGSPFLAKISGGWTDGWADGWMVGWIDRWTDGWTDGWIDGQMDGWTLR